MGECGMKMNQNKTKVIVMGNKQNDYIRNITNIHFRKLQCIKNWTRQIKKKIKLFI